MKRPTLAKVKEGECNQAEYDNSANGKRLTLAKVKEGECSQAEYDSSAAGRRLTLAKVKEGECSQAEYDSSAYGNQLARARQRRGAASQLQSLELARLGSYLSPEDVEVARRELFFLVLKALQRDGRLYDIGITLANRANGGSRLAPHLRTGLHVRILRTTCTCTCACACNHTCF